MKMEHVTNLLNAEVDKQDRYILECEREIYFLEIQLHIAEEYKQEKIEKWKIQLSKHEDRKNQCLDALDLVMRYQYENNQVG